jgi:hypothetical protein
MPKPKVTGADKAALMGAIQALLEDEENNVALPMTTLNQGIAKLSQESSRLIARVGNKLIAGIAARAVESDNHIERLGTAILAPLYTWQAENDLLLTQLAAKTGLTKPGDSLEMALVAQTAEAPELAYSATLLIALREAMGEFRGLIEVLREIRDRMPPIAASVAGEARERGPTIHEPSINGKAYRWQEPG